MKNSSGNSDCVSTDSNTTATRSNDDITGGSKGNIIRRLYDWILSWAKTPWGSAALFILALTEASFFIVPPDVLLIALCLGCTRRSFRYALICLTGTLVGAACAYGVGLWAWGAVDHWFIPRIFSIDTFNQVRNIYEQWNFWAVFTAGFTPIPYKIFTIAAGVFRINFGMFMLASAVGRGLRFFFIGWLIWQFGAPIKKFIDNYFNWLVMALTILLIGGFILLRYVF